MYPLLQISPVGLSALTNVILGFSAPDDSKFVARNVLIDSAGLSTKRTQRLLAAEKSLKNLLRKKLTKKSQSLKIDEI